LKHLSFESIEKLQIRAVQVITVKTHFKCTWCVTVVYHL